MFTEDYTADSPRRRAPVGHEMGKANQAESACDRQRSQQARAWSPRQIRCGKPPTPPFTHIMPGLRARQRTAITELTLRLLNSACFCSYRSAARTGDGLSELLPFRLGMGPRCFNHSGFSLTLLLRPKAA